uniref:(northern house mosquito) hypothetical protein n=1 Tax=Culex pipiens TaxID=7175 RepID=A0A8D8GAV7_CULPI
MFSFVPYRVVNVCFSVPGTDPDGPGPFAEPPWAEADAATDETELFRKLLLNKARRELVEGSLDRALLDADEGSCCLWIAGMAADAGGGPSCSCCWAFRTIGSQYAYEYSGLRLLSVLLLPVDCWLC